MSQSSYGGWWSKGEITVTLSRYLLFPERSIGHKRPRKKKKNVRFHNWLKIRLSESGRNVRKLQAADRRSRKK